MCIRIGIKHIFVTWKEVPPSLGIVQGLGCGSETRFKFSIARGDTILTVHSSWMIILHHFPLQRKKVWKVVSRFEESFVRSFEISSSVLNWQNWKFWRLIWTFLNLQGLNWKFQKLRTEYKILETLWAEMKVSETLCTKL